MAVQVTDEDKRLAATYRAPVPTPEQFLDDPFYLGGITPPCDVQRRVFCDVLKYGSGINEVALCWGRRAGKSYLVSLFILYAAYRTLCLRDAQDYYGLGTGSLISIVNVSITGPNAKKVVFGEVAGKIDLMPCFSEPGFKRNMKIESELEWPDAGLVVHPSSSNPKGDLGSNVLLAVMDEASWYEEVAYSVRQSGMQMQGRFDQAQAIYDLIAPAVFETGNARWHRDSLLLSISAPRYVDDFTERKQREAVDDPNIYAMRLPTWEGRPKSRLCGETFQDAVCGAVPVEYQGYFQKNPEQARRNYGAQPSDAIGGFFSDPSAIKAHVSKTLQSPFDAAGALLPSFRGNGKPPLHIHVDLGLRRDACGIAGAYSGAGMVTAAFYKRITPADHGGEIDFEQVRQFIVDLRDKYGWRIAKVTFDGWQSVDSRQLLQKAGIATDELSVDRSTQAYDTLKELLLTDKLDYYEDEQLFGELRRLELVKGKKVDHPPGGSKDVADALAGAVFGAAQGTKNRWDYLRDEIEDDETGATP